MPLEISIDARKEVLSRFKKAAKDAYPKEIYAYLLGQDAGTYYLIEDLYFPEKVIESTTKNAVYMQDWWPSEVKEYAKENDLSILGDIHSHPRNFKKWKGLMSEVTPSEGDYVDGWHGLCGICAVIQTRGGSLRSKIAFYGPTSKITLREI